MATGREGQGVKGRCLLDDGLGGRGGQGRRGGGRADGRGGGAAGSGAEAVDEVVDDRGDHLLET